MSKMIMVCHSLNNNTCMSLVVSLCLHTNSSGQSDPPECLQIIGIYPVVVL